MALELDYRNWALNALETSRQIPDLDKAAELRELAEWYLLLARSYARRIDPPESHEDVRPTIGSS